MLSTRRVVCVALFGVFGLTPAGAQPPNDDATRIVAGWDQLRQAAPVVRYMIRWDSFPLNLKPDAPKPGEDGAYTGSAIVLFDPARRRLRVDTDYIFHFTGFQERLSRMRMIHRYDGREQSIAEGIDKDAAKALVEPVFQHIEFGPWGSTVRWPDEISPLFWAHGLIWTSRTPGPPFDWRPKPGQFRAAGREEVEGRTCVVLHDTTEAKETLWVDDERGVITRRRIEWAKGSGDEIRIRYQDTPHGWLPQTWEQSNQNPGQPPVVTNRVRVETITFDPVVSDDDFRDDFRIALRPEMEPEPAPFDTLRTWLRRIVWLGLGGVATAAVGVLVWLRRRNNDAGSRSMSE